MKQCKACDSQVEGEHYCEVEKRRIGADDSEMLNQIVEQEKPKKSGKEKIEKVEAPVEAPSPDLPSA